MGCVGSKPNSKEQSKQTKNETTIPVVVNQNKPLPNDNVIPQIPNLKQNDNEVKSEKSVEKFGQTSDIKVSNLKVDVIEDHGSLKKLSNLDDFVNDSGQKNSNFKTGHKQSMNEEIKQQSVENFGSSNQVNGIQVSVGMNVQNAQEEQFKKNITNDNDKIVTNYSINPKNTDNINQAKLENTNQVIEQFQQRSDFVPNDEQENYGQQNLVKDGRKIEVAIIS